METALNSNRGDLARKPPVVETDRLILRGRRLDDFPAYAAMWADPTVVKHISGVPLTREAAWQKFARSAGLWELFGFGPWTVEEKSTGRFLGDVGPAIYRREIDYDDDDRPEFGWSLVADAHGHGYGYELLAAAIKWTEDHVSRDVFFCIIAPENHASIRLAAKVGFRETRILPYKGDQVLLFERSARPEKAD